MEQNDGSSSAGGGQGDISRVTDLGEAQVTRMRSDDGASHLLLKANAAFFSPTTYLPLKSRSSCSSNTPNVIVLAIESLHQPLPQSSVFSPKISSE